MDSTIQKYLASLRDERAAVLGIGVSNTPLVKMLLRTDVEVTAYDKRQEENFDDRAEKLKSLGAELCLDPDYLDGLDHDVIFRTPGLHSSVSQLLVAREWGSTITSEMETFSQVCPCKTITTTDNDGRATTTTVIAELLKVAGQSVYVGSSISKPLLPGMDGMVLGDMTVPELSSFRLMTMEQNLGITMVTSLASNHLDVHKSMEGCIAAEESIFIHQGADDLLVLNQGNEITRGSAANTRDHVTWFNRREELEQGVSVRDEAIWVRNVMHERPVFYLENILLPDEHNAENYMAAIGILDGPVPDQVVRDFAAKFAGVEHRIGLVWTRNGVRYYNDPIVSSPPRTITGLRSFHQKVVLITGGYDRYIPFDVPGPEVVEYVGALVLTDGAAPKLRQAVERVSGYDPAALPIVEYKDFKAAVLAAYGLTQPGDVVLLSPAYASFSHFRNSMEQGAAFKRIIYGLE